MVYYMARGPPREVVKILRESRDADLTDPASKSSFKQKLKRLARSKKTWYTLITLALGAAGWVVVRKYMDLKNLKGLGKVTTGLLESAGKKLNIAPTPFGANRLQFLERKQEHLVDLVLQGKLDHETAVRDYMKLFKPSDPEDLWKSLGADFAIKLDRATTASSLPYIELWPYLVKRTIGRRLGKK